MSARTASIRCHSASAAEPTSGGYSRSDQFRFSSTTSESFEVVGPGDPLQQSLGHGERQLAVFVPHLPTAFFVRLYKKQVAPGRFVQLPGDGAERLEFPDHFCGRCVFAESCPV